MASAVRERCDVAVVGAGMAGASLAYELSQRGLDVVVIEREPQPGYHSTGRSAAFFAPWYGNPTVRAVSRVSRAFFERPPEGFAAHPLATPRACVLYAGSAQRTAFERLCADVSAEVSVQVLDGADRVRALLPMLRPQAAERAFVDRSSFDIDVHALLHGYLRAARARGVRVATGFELESAQRDAGRWRLAGRGGEVSAATVAVCAGAWADSLASLFGAEPLGIEPRRRTVIVFQAQRVTLPPDCPMAVTAAEDLYFRPEAGRVLASPADETASAPCDAQPEEIDVATTIDRIERDTTLKVERLTARWAGLRSFAPDRAPAAGPDPDVGGLFWLVGQGGYGIQMAPALAGFAAATIVGNPVDPRLLDEGFEPARVAPLRLRC